MSSTPSPTLLLLISESFIKPHPPIEESNQICYLTPSDICMLSGNYIQKGLLFKKPTSLINPQNFTANLLNNLKHSLSLTLFHFYPLAGRLVTNKTQNPPSYTIFVDCKNSPGAKFIHSTLDLKISDILSPVDVPPIVHSLFDHHKAVNHDGHTLPLLSIQVTELLDGVFIGCSMNHSIADGTSYWNFFNTWSQIFQQQELSVSHRPPIHNHLFPFPEGVGPLINLPFKHHDEFVHRSERPKLRERIFHFSADSIAKLKARANRESNSNTTKISSFQSLSALVWRSITRARGLELDQKTSCKLAINSRSRLEPQLPNEYFGNMIHAVSAEANAGELGENDLGWAAWKLHMAVANHNDGVVRQSLEAWLKSPFVVRLDLVMDPFAVLMGSSPRFNMYGNEFGMGKAVAVRSGYASKLDGKVTSYPGHQGGGSIDLEVCLLPKNMIALESDQEFMNAVS